MKPMMRILLILVVLTLLSANAVAFEGPLEVKNQFPLFLPLAAPRLESAKTANSFSSGLSHSSVFMVKNSRDWSVNLDMEITELALRYKREIPGLFELGLELPVLSFESGFLDPFLESYHSTFGFADYGRKSRPSDSFLYEVRRNGKIVVQGKNGKIGVGDLRVSAKRTLFTGDPVISVKAEVELPTGDADQGFGSGSIDAGLSLHADKKISDTFMSYWNFGVLFPGRLKAEESISPRSSVWAGAALEAALSQKFALIGQVLFQTSPYPKTGIGTVDRVSALLAVGGRYASGKDSFELSITEDPNTAGAPDVTFNFGYKRRF